MSRFSKFGGYTRVVLMVAALVAVGLSSCRSHKQEARVVIVYADSALDDEPVIDGDDEGGDADQQGSTAILLNEIDSWMGSPYKYGGHSRSGTDCSGMVMEIFLSVYGVSLPHSSVEMYKHCDAIDEGDLRVGDLVFFSFVNSGKISHVGIYIGDGRFAHATTRRGVMINHMDERYYRRGFVAAGRVRM